MLQLFILGQRSFHIVAWRLRHKVQNALFGMALSGWRSRYRDNFQPGRHHYIWFAALLVIGAVIGGIVAMRVEMTGMPQLVAALHSFVGLAAVLIGINSDIMPPEAGRCGKIIHEVEIFVGVFIGAITLLGLLSPMANCLAFWMASP